VDLVQPPLHGQRRQVGEVRLHCAPDALDRVAVGAVAGTVEQLDAIVTGQPASNGPTGVAADVVEDDRDGGCRGVGQPDLLQEVDEGAAVGLIR